EVAPFTRRVGMHEWGVVAWAADQAREQGGVLERERAHRLPEVEERRLADAVDRGRPALTEIDLVQVVLEDRRLLVSALDDQGHRRFLELAREGPVGRQEEVLHELLRERAAALAHFAGGDVRPGRAEHAPRIDPGMRLEALILDRQHRVEQMTRHLAEPHGLALLAMRTEVRTDQLRLEQDGCELAPAGV